MGPLCHNYLPPRVLVCVSYMVSACHVIRLEVWVQSLGHVTTYISHVTTSPLSKLAFLKLEYDY